MRQIKHSFKEESLLYGVFFTALKNWDLISFVDFVVELLAATIAHATSPLGAIYIPEQWRHSAVMKVRMRNSQPWHSRLS